VIKKTLTLLFMFSLTACEYDAGFSYFWSKNNETAETSQQRGFNNFMYYSFGGFNNDGLETGAVIPWEVAMGAVLYNNGLVKNDLPGKLQESGFLYSKLAKNAPDGLEFKRIEDAPLGIVRGRMTSSDNLPELEVGIVGCALCHSSNGYDSSGLPLLNEVWLGDASGSFNPERFINEIYKGFNKAIDNRRSFRKFMQEEFGKKQLTRALYLNGTLDQIEEGLEEVSASLDRATPGHNGGPGVTNGVASLKNFSYGFHNINEFYNFERGYTSIPPIFDRNFRSSLLYDGLYSATDKESQVPVERERGFLSTFELGKIVSFFTIPTLSNTIELAANTFEKSEDIMNYFSSAEREKFPGTLDDFKVFEGQKVYENKCQSCHGTYSNSLTNPVLMSFPNRLVSLSEIKTDSVRLEVIDDKLIDYLNDSNITKSVAVNKNDGYVATLLSQVWKSAPYLHNGSVPSLAALLGLEERPSKFNVGGHALDYLSVGISYPESYDPWSTPEVYDTSLRGRSNLGHEDQFEGLSDTEKWSVIEYLKLL